MIRHWAFFKKSDTSFGRFYPRQYVVAGYPSFEAAHEAESAFAAAGVSADDVRAATGDFVVNRLEAHHQVNWLQRTLAHVAELAGAESRFLRDDADLANQGGAFLFLFAPDDSQVSHARVIFAQYPPVYARRYLNAAIEPIIDSPHNPAS